MVFYLKFSSNTLKDETGIALEIKFREKFRESKLFIHRNWLNEQRGQKKKKKKKNDINKANNRICCFWYLHLSAESPYRMRNRYSYIVLAVFHN